MKTKRIEPCIHGDHKPQHTPTPCKAEYRHGVLCIVDAKDHIMAKIEPTRWEGETEPWTVTENRIADTIVRAVNCHEELVNACKLALERWGKAPGTAEIGESNKVGDALLKAIAKAEGK